MSWVQHMRKALEDRRQPVLRGIVEAVDGRVVQVRTPDGRLIPAAPLALVGGGKGVYHRYASGDDVVLLCDQGDPNGAVCLSSPRTEGQDAPGEVDHEGLYIYEDRVEVRAAEGDDVQGVVMRPVLDGLYSALGAVSDLLDVLAAPGTPPGSAAQNAALLTAVRTQIGLPAAGTAAVLSNVLNDLDTSRAGQGTGPYCSDVLRAVVDGPLGGGGGGGGSQGATLEDIDDAIQAHLEADHADLATNADIAALDARIDALESGGAGVTSVNGQTGVVVLDAADVGADATGTASSAVSTHAAAIDPHAGYVLESREGAANGIATLNASALVPRAQLGTGSSGFLAYGGTWATLVAGDIPDLSSIYAPAAGATSITTLGTVTTGVWQGTAVAVAYGGTGATTQSGARTNLGLAIGTNVQAYSAALDTLGALTLGTTNHHTLRVSGGAWGVGTLDAASIASGTLGTARLGTGTATGAVLVDGAWVAGSSSGHVLRWNGSAWASAALSASDVSTGSIGNIGRLGYDATTADATTTSNTTGTTTNTPSWSVTSGVTYVLEVIGTMKSTISTNGWRCQIEESGGATSSKCVGVVAYVGVGDEPITAANTWTAQGSAPTAETHIHIRVLYACTGSGTLKLAIRGEGSGPTVTLYAGTLYAKWEYP